MATSILPDDATERVEGFDEEQMEARREYERWSTVIRRNERIEHEDSEQHGTWGCGHADEWEVIDR